MMVINDTRKKMLKHNLLAKALVHIQTVLVKYSLQIVQASSS
jgi:hypothetical protein